jgi:outer membrane receptor protein involved in Fe transport
MRLRLPRRSRLAAPLLLLAILSSPPIVSAQRADRSQSAASDRLVRGRVLSGEGAPIADASIRASDAGRGVSSSATGAFELRAPAGTLRLRVTRIGFRPTIVALAPDVDTVTVRLAPHVVEIDPVSVASEPAYSAASSRTIRELDIRLRPRESSQELLRLAPGLVIAQHAGGGKAEQIFLRGFDADHGTDVAVSVDGVPVNMVSHAHGQGYADLHFLMPEVVERTDVRKGPYDARDGDLATAGAVDFVTKDRVAAPLVEARAGSFGTMHGIGLVPFGGDASRTGGYVAASAHRADGPFVAEQDYRRLNGFGKLTAPVGRGAQLVASASAFDSRWNASGQIPERAVDAGLIGRFGALDSTEGGATSRYDARLALRSSAGGERDWQVETWLTRYRFRLFSNFTFFAADSVNGDGIEQVDDRWLAGFGAAYGMPALTPLGGRLTVGVGGRADWADVELNAQTERRVRGALVSDRVRQRHGLVWAAQELALGSRVRLELGLRGDLFHFDVLNRPLEGGGAGLPRASGSRTVSLVSPKANLAVALAQATTLFVNAGAGFHSNDARDAILAGAAERVVPRALGAEVGIRQAWRGASVAAALWALDLQSELVWVGDEGTTEASGRTRRVGVDLEARARLLPWLWADGDLNLSRGRLRDEPAGADRVPLAPTVTAAAGLTVRELGPVSGGVRMRHVGARAADETNGVRARGYTLVELFAGWRAGPLTLTAAVDNLFDVEWNEAQFATTSRLRGEAVPVTELHFTPGAPRSVQVGVRYGF